MKTKSYMKRNLIACVILLSLSQIIPAQPLPGKVYDDAELFTPTQIETLNKNAQALVNEIKVDLIIVTTYFTESKSSMEYADDYFDYHGFGIGPSRDGMLMLINMDTREVWISTHSLALDYFKDSDIESLLDNIFVPLKERNYFGAAQEFLNNAAQHIRIKKAAEGPATVTVLEPQIKISDYAGLLNEPRKTELSVKARQIADTYGVDCIILTLNSTGGKSMTAFAEDIFLDSGYGLGQNKDGILLLIKMQDDGNFNLEIFTNGSAHTYINDQEVDNLLRTIGTRMEQKDYFAAGTSFIDYTYTKVRHYRAKGLERLLMRLTPELIGKSLLFGCGLAFLVVLIMYIAQRRRLPRAPRAQTYMNRNGTNFTLKNDTFLRTHTSRQAIPKSDDSSSPGSSSGSGRSSGGGSYSSGTSSHRSSSGSTHGGGGRSF